MDEDEAQQILDDDDGYEPGDSKPKELTQYQKDLIMKTYNDHDKDKNKTLSAAELRRALQFLGLNPTVKDVTALMKKHNIKARKVPYEEFETMFMDAIHNASPKFDLFEAFSHFDKDRSGTLDRNELKTCLQSLGERMPDDEVDELFNILDTNHDGILSIAEAAKLLA